MPGATFLSGDSVDLCTMEEEDIEFVTEGVNDPDVRVPLGIAQPRNETQHEEWFEEEVSSEDDLTLLIVPRNDDEAVGVIRSSWMNERHGHAMLSCWLAADAHSQGYGKDATRTLITYLFEERRMETVRAEAFEFNKKSNALLESIGMRHVGTLPNWAFVGGEHHDSNIYAVTADQWWDEQ
ncbi:GNAT family N-acetyltransferase [Haloarchaeobius sp. TZWSO28]|uniref:GNAT family N-acetyltransferase n=1 Tax=Haloarchaeobius sp. TZWSO28 TaxID=3446119 RepID=UPI003EBC1B04